MLKQKKIVQNKRWLKSVGIIISLILFGIGYGIQSYNTILIAILIIWIENVIFAIEDLKNRIFFLIFSICQFVFLIVRPLINFIKGDNWAEKYWVDAVQFAVIALFLSVIAMQAGAKLISHYSKRKRVEKEVKKPRFEYKYRVYIQIVSAIGFTITWVCNMLTGVEKVWYMRGKSYLDYYVDFTSSFPYIIIAIASMMPYFLCIFLAMKPIKKIAFVCLSMYIISAVPLLIIGVRNPIVLNCIFAFLYYFIRDVLEDKKKWIGRWEKILMIVAIPTATILMGVLAHLRSAEQVTRNIGSIIVDFLFSQGVSFEVLVIGYGAMPYLPQRTFRNYTFGGIIDYIMHGSIAQKLWGATAVPDGNCLFNALESNNFAHNMSYIAKGKDAYLNGEGFGSSYILETYTDFGYIGVVVFSLLLGALLVYAMVWLQKNFFTFTVTLVALTTIFFVPRAEALGWIQFLLYLQFWIPVIGTIIGAVILSFLDEKFRKKDKVTI